MWKGPAGKAKLAIHVQGSKRVRNDGKAKQMMHVRIQTGKGLLVISPRAIGSRPARLDPCHEFVITAVRTRTAITEVR
jgi:hypothetical protein